ncbi:NADH-quinone oxidoreductase subunit 5 family protein [Ekhidna sp.]
MEALFIIIILFLPLAGGLLAFLFEKQTKLFSISGVSVSFFTSLYLAITKFNYAVTFEWLPSMKMSILIDNASITLIALVTLVSTLVHVFSMEYMKKERGQNRYFAKLGFFTFSMIGLLIADHLILLFVFWELVGLASYLLIGFWYKSEGIPSSARLAFMVNRIADVALLAGILILNSSGSLTISYFNDSWLFLPSILITIGAFGKSAQFPFSGWLTKAMVGPTPVSALIHAATMVAAGVYLLYRVAPFLHIQALTVIALIGSFTALYGGICALFQHDIKKVLAYSTISQLGYMVLGIGVGGEEASMFHLFTHAFFKAGLFLGAGSIIHFMHHATKLDAQNMKNMGGLRSVLPWTYRTFLICSLALVGIPLFSGFMSKEGIIIAAWGWAEQTGTWAYLVPDIALITAFLTAMYVGRMLLLIFWGESRLGQSVKLFSEKLNITLPLILLAIGSLWFIFNLNPLAHTSWLTNIFGGGNSVKSDFISQKVMFLSLLMTLAGLVLAYSFFKSGSNYNKNYLSLDQNRFRAAIEGFYLISLYHVFGKAMERISTYAFVIDQKVLDRIVHLVGIGGVVLSKIISLIDRFLIDGPVNLIGYLSRLIGRLLANLSSRDLQSQLALLILGLILILSWILFF